MSFANEASRGLEEGEAKEHQVGPKGSYSGQVAGNPGCQWELLFFQWMLILS